MIRAILNLLLLVVGAAALWCFFVPGKGADEATHTLTSTLGATWSDVEGVWYRRTITLKEGQFESKTVVRLKSPGWWLLLGGLAALLLRRFFAADACGAERLFAALVVLGAIGLQVGMTVSWLDGIGLEWRWEDYTLHVVQRPGEGQTWPTLFALDELVGGSLFVLGLLAAVFGLRPPPRAED